VSRPSPGRVEVRLTATSGLRLAATAVAVVLVLLGLERARTVLHWLVTAAAAALLLDGPVRALAQRGVRRGVAVAAVTVTVLAAAALLTYGAVDAVVEQYASLRETAPAAVLQVAGELSSDGATTGVDERVRRLVDTAPRRLFGSPASAARTAAERVGEVTLVVTLTVFMLVAYERFEGRLARSAAAGVLERWSGVDAGLSAGARSARSVVLRACVGGLVVALLARGLDAPGPVVLGLWAAWWRLLPVLGPLVGAAPLLLLVLAEHPAPVAAAAAVLVVTAEVLLRLAWPVSRELGPVPVPMAFLSAVAFAAGFEVGGVVGAAVVVVLAHLAVGAAEEAVPGSRPAGQAAP
jgi:predicted PurR-regulated permease PerM